MAGYHADGTQYVRRIRGLQWKQMLMGEQEYRHPPHETRCEILLGRNLRDSEMSMIW